MRVIIGGSSGFGRYAVLQALKNGLDVMYTYRRQPIEAVYTNFAVGGSLNSVMCDLTDQSQIEALADVLLNQEKEITELLFCAAEHSDRKKFTEFTNEEFFRIFQVNVFATCDVIRRIIPKLKSSQPSSIVILSSQVSRTGGFRIYPYAMSKGALDTMALSLSKELVEHGIRLNLVSPGQIVPSENHILRKLPSGAVSYQKLHEVIQNFFDGSERDENGNNVFFNNSTI